MTTPAYKFFRHWNVQDIPQGARIGIYGAGLICDFLVEQLQDRPDITICHFFDTYKERQYRGHHVEVYNPEKIYDVDYIIVTSMHWVVIVDHINPAQECVTLTPPQERYKLCIVDDTNKLIFVRNSHSASGSTQQMMEVHPCTQQLIDTHNPKYKDYFKFSFVRNQFDRFLSIYDGFFIWPKENPDDLLLPDGTPSLSIYPLLESLGMDPNAMTIDDFIDVYFRLDEDVIDPHLRRQTTTLGDFVDFVGIYENYDDEIERLKREANLGPEYVRKIKIPLFRRKRPELTDNQRQKLYTYYKSDFDAYDLDPSWHSGIHNKNYKGK